jgi:P2 family phage contractile tail tube protein
MDQHVIDVHVYEDSVRYAGLAKVTLPDITYLTQNISGAGVAGNIEAVTPGIIDAMTVTLNFPVASEETMKLSEPRPHNIDLRVAKQSEDPVAGTLPVKGDKHVMKVIPKKATGGALAQASPQDVSIECAVHYWATFMNGVKKMEIDPLNYIFMVNEVDYLSDVRNALGR